MNDVKLAGRAIDEPRRTLVTTKKGQISRLAFTLSVPRPKIEGQDWQFDNIPIVCWGIVADKTFKVLRRKGRCIVDGAFTVADIVTKGRHIKKSWVTANRVYVLEPAAVEIDDGSSIYLPAPGEEGEWSLSSDGKNLQNNDLGV